MGGARPKAMFDSDNKKYIAKFSSGSDVYSVVKAEYIAMRLARLAGLNVAGVQLVRASHKDVLLIERFDRVQTGQGWQRCCLVSALTLLGLDEIMARYASYENLAEIIRHRFDNAPETLCELFSRLAFNILCGNTDDHARNHAAFWDGRILSLTPAYDLCPQGRAGNEASQAMLISGANRMSRLAGCLDAAPQFLLSHSEAREIIAHQVQVIDGHWDEVCDDAALSRVDRAVFWHRQFLNPYAFEGYEA
ncbi:MAG: HipA domain-containing protein [Mariprofundaceae bacterium]|nr:HipA domain-containing protein [Mariprofundaceae bacterium]